MAFRKMLGSATMAACMLLAPYVCAQPTAAEKETARTLLDEGEKKSKSGDHAGALKAYAAADELVHVPTTGIRLGKAQAQLGQLVEALDTWLRVARSTPSQGESPFFAEARAEASKLASEIVRRIPAVRLTISGVKDSAQLSVSVNSVRLPPAALGAARKVNPGRHRIEVSAEGYEPVNRVVTVQEGEVREIAIELEPERTAPVSSHAATGQTSVTPNSEAPPSSGDSGARGYGLAYVGFAVAGVGLGVGAVTGVMSLSRTSDVEKKCQNGRCPPELQGDLDDANTLATVSNVGFGVGLFGVALGIYGLARGGGSSEAGHVARKRSPSISPGLSLNGAWIRGGF